MFMFPRLVITPPNHLRTNITIGVTNKYAIRPLLLNPQENSSNTSAPELWKSFKIPVKNLVPIQNNILKV